MNRLILATSSALLLGFSAVAQETEAAAPTSSGASLTIRTTDSRLARNAMRNFGSASEMPEIEDGQGIVLTLDDGGQMTARAGEARGWMHITAHPPALMRTFAAQVQQGRAMAQMFAGMGLGEAGFDYEQIQEIVDTLFSIPEQVERLEVQLAEEPDEEHGADVQVSLVPVADSWMGGMMSKLTTNPRGVKMLDSDGAMLEGAIDVDLPKVAPSLLPMMKFFSGMGATTDEERQQGAEIAEASAGVLAGTMSFQWNLDTGVESVMGVADPGKMLEMWRSDEYAASMKRASEIAGNAVADFNPDAGEYRGTQIAEMRVEYDTPEDMPLVEDGIMVTNNAVVGDSMVSTSMSSGQAGVKSLIDMVMDDELAAKGLGQGVLMRANVRLAELIDFMAEMQNAPLPPGDMPEQASIVVTKQGDGIALRITVR